MILRAITLEFDASPAIPNVVIPAPTPENVVAVTTPVVFINKVPDITCPDGRVTPFENSTGPVPLKSVILDVLSADIRLPLYRIAKVFPTLTIIVDPTDT